ncbi:MAG: hypothetical protein K2I75_04315 [Clostridiales bacterium]|nr:hypothetical protein [Clostridiales bacterium]
MKKTVKALIVAASVAAVVGVGAVSFAAWTGSGTTTASQNTNTTGSVSVVGFGNEASLAAVTNLMPWDQDSGTTVAHYTLPKVTSGNEGYKITVTADLKNSWTGSLYVIVDDSASTAASDPDTAANGWKAIDGTASVFTFTATGDTPKQLYAHVILDSDKSADMNQTYDLTFTLAADAA